MHINKALHTGNVKNQPVSRLSVRVAVNEARSTRVPGLVVFILLAHCGNRRSPSMSVETTLCRVRSGLHAAEAFPIQTSGPSMLARSGLFSVQLDIGGRRGRMSLVCSVYSLFRNVRVI